ncbi:uncharacterized protein L199_008219 [Kwoniella botswanensis]|uniref:uncharacterized protein n=1 Tax=Kwoniella botswanensis TaxID=1268659 RepID=UPI00315CECFF
MSSSSSSLRSNSQTKRYTPNNYAATKNEVGVFTTPGYSEDIKTLWKFKNAEEAGKSAEGIWELFEGYRDKNDFVGMDICRKFIQMGRTRSLRYALRPGGRKYDPSTGEARERTGKVYDQGKLEGAEVYEKWLGKCWDDECYKKAWESWREGKDDIEVVDEGNVKDQSDVEDLSGEGYEKDQKEKKRKRPKSAMKGEPEVKAKDHPGSKKRIKKS